MKPATLVKALEDVARQLGFQVRYEKGNFRGGVCVVEDDPFIMLNKRHTPDIHVRILAESLRPADTDSVYLKPKVRAALEQTWDALDAEAQAGAADSVDVAADA